MLWSDEEYNSTWDQLTIGSDIHSVMVPSGAGWWIDTYKYEDCDVVVDSEIRTYTQDTVGNNDCIDVE